MAVEIKELVFKMVVTNDSKNNISIRGETETDIPSSKIIQEAVKEVMRILERQKTR